MKTDQQFTVCVQKVLANVQIYLSAIQIDLFRRLAPNLNRKTYF